MEKLRAFICIIAAASLGSLAASANSNVVYYSFNASNTIADVGSAISTFGNAGITTNMFNTGSTLNAEAGFVAGVAPNETSWTGNTNYFSVTIDSTGLQGLIVSFWAQKSGTGPTNIDLAYSTTGAGGSFTFLPSVVAAASPGSVYTQDVSAVTALDNNPDDVFRIYGLNAGAAGGTLRVDNVAIDVVPEPSTIALIGAGMLGLLVVRRRRS
jgi:hypothetical protein